MQGCRAQPRAQVAPQRRPPALERPWWAVEVAPRVLRAAQILGSLSVGPAAAALKVVPEGADRPLSLPAGSSERPLPRPQDKQTLSLAPPALALLFSISSSASPTGNLPLPQTPCLGRKALALSPPGNTSCSFKTRLKQYLPRLGGLALSAHHPVLQSKLENLGDQAQCLEPTMRLGAHENILF